MNLFFLFVLLSPVCSQNLGDVNLVGDASPLFAGSPLAKGNLLADGNLASPLTTGWDFLQRNVLNQGCRYNGVRLLAFVLLRIGHADSHVTVQRNIPTSSGLPNGRHCERRLL